MSIPWSLMQVGTFNQERKGPSSRGLLREKKSSRRFIWSSSQQPPISHNMSRHQQQRQRQRWCRESLLLQQLHCQSGRWFLINNSKYLLFSSHWSIFNIYITITAWYLRLYLLISLQCSASVPGWIHHQLIRRPGHGSNDRRCIYWPSFQPLLASQPRYQQPPSVWNNRFPEYLFPKPQISNCKQSMLLSVKWYWY